MISSCMQFNFLLLWVNQTIDHRLHQRQARCSQITSNNCKIKGIIFQLLLCLFRGIFSDGDWFQNGGCYLMINTLPHFNVLCMHSTHTNREKASIVQLCLPFCSQKLWLRRLLFPLIFRIFLKAFQFPVLYSVVALLSP